MYGPNGELVKSEKSERQDATPRTRTCGPDELTEHAPKKQRVDV